MPALAVARAFRAEEPGGELLLVGRAGGPEERLVPEAGFPLRTVSIRGLNRDALRKNLALPLLVPAAFREGGRIVDEFRPDVVLGVGGYAMAPSIWAARRRGIGTALYDDAVAVLRTRGARWIRNGVKETEAGGVAFARAIGAVERDPHWESRLDLASFDPAPFAGAPARVAAAGAVITT